MNAPPDFRAPHEPLTPEATALLGGAILVAVRGDTSFAERPEPVTPHQTTSAGGGARKGDKLVAEQPIASARHSVRAPMSQRIGDREVIRVRPFVRLSTNLSLTSGVYAANIPPFNPLRLFAEGAPSGERYAEPVTEMADADVSITKRDLADMPIVPGKANLTDADVVNQMEEERANLAAADRRAALPIPPQLMLSRTLAQGSQAAGAAGNLLSYAPATDTSFSGIEVRVVPENVTNAPKTPMAATREPQVEEKLLITRRGENFETVVRNAGASRDQIVSMMKAFDGRVKVAALPEGQVLQALFAPGPRPGDPRQIVRVALLDNGRPSAAVAVNDKGLFVPVHDF